MYLNPFQVEEHKKEPDIMLTIQLTGWVYESHAWVVVNEENQDHKICKWCGAESTVDMVVDEEDSEMALCRKNPIITGVVMQTKVDGILP